MIRKSPALPRKDFAAASRKTFHSGLCHLLQTEFPATFGPAVTRLFADRVDDLYSQFHPLGTRFGPGQVLWVAVAASDPPQRDKRIEDTQLIPVTLDLVTQQDIDEAGVKGAVKTIRPRKILRLFQQAFDQGGVLSYPDVALLLGVSTSTIGSVVTTHEKATGASVPRRGTIHDMGRSVTHKRVICFKALVEHKPTSQVARETYHSEEEVEYYVQCLRRIKLCSETGMNADEIVQATSYSKGLVNEYLALIREFELPTLNVQ